MALSFSFVFSIAFSIASSTVGPTKNDHIHIQDQMVQVTSTFQCKCSSTVNVLNSFNSYQVSVTETLHKHNLTWSDNKVRELITVKVLHTSMLNTTMVTLKVLHWEALH